MDFRGTESGAGGCGSKSSASLYSLSGRDACNGKRKGKLTIEISEEDVASFKLGELEERW